MSLTLCTNKDSRTSCSTNVVQVLRKPTLLAGRNARKAVLKIYKIYKINPHFSLNFLLFSKVGVFN